MIMGALYSPSDPELVEAHRRARRLCRLFNAATEDEPERQRELLEELLGAIGEKVEVHGPFHCDYGENIRLANGVFINYGAVFLDCAPIVLGEFTMLGPGVHIYAADHPREARIRATGLELARPVEIGRHVWIGGGAIICPGVQIGDNTTIGAGSVVAGNIPANVIAAGNPCRVLRELHPADGAP